MKYNGIVNKFKFELDTIIFDNTMLEISNDEEIESIIETTKEKVYKHKRETNITYPKIIDGTLYDITYIDKNGFMWSEIDLNIIELTMRLGELKNKVEKNYLNIFKSKDRIDLK